MQTFESETLKMRICENYDVYADVYYACGIASYWPGMHNTVSKDIFMDPCERKSF